MAMASKSKSFQPLLLKGVGINSGAKQEHAISNRKKRTIILSTLLILFFSLSASFSFQFQNKFESMDEDTSTIHSAESAWNLIVAGCLVIGGSAMLTILLFIIDCDNKLGGFTGIALIFGGLLYLVGWIWYIQVFQEFYYPPLNWGSMTDDARIRVKAMLASKFGEALLPSGSAMLLGIDVWIHLFDGKTFRLLFNLILLCVISGLCGPTYIINSQKAGASWQTVNSAGYPWIATGYFIILPISIIYVSLYIFKCVKYDCADTAYARLSLASALIFGGILCSIGYYMFATDFNKDLSTDITKLVVYYIGYTILIGGLCIVWAWDIALDDLLSKA